MDSLLHRMRVGSITFLLALAMTIGLVGDVYAGPPAFPPESASGSIGLQGEISTAAPTQGATIITPTNGSVFTTLPITVTGLCPKGLLIKIFSNNVFVGSVVCGDGSYSIQVDLFNGSNQLVAIDYDALDQAGPDSNTVTVTFNSAQFLQYGTYVELTSIYAERGAAPNTTLIWPVILSGGTGPYAISVDWGDGSPSTLISQPDTGTINLSHVYRTAGIFTVIVKATDKNGGQAFLQLVAVSTGATQSNNKNINNNSVIITKVLWWPALAMMPLIFAAFWVGRRYELYTIRRELEKDREQDKADQEKK
jgi:hypothetical protein